jgi:ATP-dependent Clp protease protease subunit
MAAETWLTPQEAIDAGLADSVTETAVKASAWDMSAYERAPKAEAVQDAPVEADPADEASADQHDEQPADNKANEIAARERQHAVRMRLQAA